MDDPRAQNQLEALYQETMVNIHDQPNYHPTNPAITERLVITEVVTKVFGKNGMKRLGTAVNRIGEELGLPPTEVLNAISRIL